MITLDLFNNQKRRWVYVGRDPERPEQLIDTNEYLIMDGGRGMLLDPGGMEIFPFVVSAISKVIDLHDIDFIFASHQDPDIVSSLSMWLSLNGNLEVYAPWVWELFIPHFGAGKKINPIPDEGMKFKLNGSNDLVLVPAHYVHSSGNFSLYDPVAKILFSGDIGAALLPPTYDSIYVENFDAHIQYMEGFHKRWMPSNRAKNKWVERVKKLDIEMMCPQHGAIFKRSDTQKFLAWFENLQVGSGV